MSHRLTFFIVILLLLCRPGYSQDTISQPIDYSVHKVYPAFAISKEKLFEAQTLVDLNEHYKSSWIKEFISVEISVIVNGTNRSIMSKNDTLTLEQKNMLKNIDPSTEISIVVRYIPDNTLKNNDIKIYDCRIPVEPEYEAEFPGGQKALNQYLKEYAIDNIPEGSFKGYSVATVKFTVNKKGQIVDPHVFWPMENDQVEELLLAAICNMPVWKPAEFADGMKVKQEMVLTVGNMESCVINALNIRQDHPN